MSASGGGPENRRQRSKEGIRWLPKWLLILMNLPRWVFLFSGGNRRASIERTIVTETGRTKSLEFALCLDKRIRGIATSEPYRFSALASTKILSLPLFQFAEQNRTIPPESNQVSTCEKSVKKIVKSFIRHLPKCERHDATKSHWIRLLSCASFCSFQFANDTLFFRKSDNRICDENSRRWTVRSR